MRYFNLLMALKFHAQFLICFHSDDTVSPEKQCLCVSCLCVWVCVCVLLLSLFELRTMDLRLCAIFTHICIDMNFFPDVSMPIILIFCHWDRHDFMFENLYKCLFQQLPWLLDKHTRSTMNV